MNLLPASLRPRNSRDGVLLIATACILLIAGWQVHDWLSMGRRPDPDVYVTFHLKCLHCGEEFVRTRGQMPPGVKGMFINTAGIRALCPKCGEPQGALMRKCPHCGELYVSIWTQGKQRGEGRDICPHCNTDVTEQTQGPELLHVKGTP